MILKEAPTTIEFATGKHAHLADRLVRPLIHDASALDAPAGAN